jgi:hypothetical protein
MPALLLPLGLAAAAAGTSGLIKPWGEPPPPWPVFVGIIFWGLLAIGIGVASFTRLARHAEQLDDGRFRFRSRHRSLIVHPSELISITGFSYFFDRSGMFPFRLKSSHGSILVDRHMPNGRDLENILREANPQLQIYRAWFLESPFAGRSGPGAVSDISSIGPR